MCAEIIKLLLHNLFSCNPKRCKILLKHINSSLHSISGKRWSDQVESIKPFGTHLRGIKSVVEELLTIKTEDDANGSRFYLKSFA